MELDKAVARVIQRVRREYGLTQRELGFRTGLDPMTISRIERGERLPSLVTLFMLAKAMDCNVWEWIAEIEKLSPVVSIAEGDLPYNPKQRGKKGASQLVLPMAKKLVRPSENRYKRKKS